MRWLPELRLVEQVKRRFVLFSLLDFGIKTEHHEIRTGLFTQDQSTTKIVW